MIPMMIEVSELTMADVSTVGSRISMMATAAPVKSTDRTTTAVKERIMISITDRLENTVSVLDGNGFEVGVGPFCPSTVPTELDDDVDGPSPQVGF